MNLRRWLAVILMMGLFLVLSALSTQADPYPYHYPHGNAYGWHGQKHHDFDRCYRKHFRRSCMGPHFPRHYMHPGPAPVAYVAPVAPVVAIPYASPQPYASQPAPRGLSGTVQYNF